MQIIGLVYLALNSCFHIVIFWGFKLGLTYSPPPGKTGTTSKSWTSRAYFCCLHISSCCHKYPLTTLLAHLVGFFAPCPFFCTASINGSDLSYADLLPPLARLPHFFVLRLPTPPVFLDPPPPHVPLIHLFSIFPPPSSLPAARSNEQSSYTLNYSSFHVRQRLFAGFHST